MRRNILPEFTHVEYRKPLQKRFRSPPTAEMLNLRADCSLYTLKPASSSCFLPDTPHLTPLVDDQFALDLTKEQTVERLIDAYFIHEVEMARAHVPQTRGKTETKQRREGKNMLRTAASVCVIFLNVQIGVTISMLLLANPLQHLLE